MVERDRPTLPRCVLVALYTANLSCSLRVVIASGPDLIAAKVGANSITHNLLPLLLRPLRLVVPAESLRSVRIALLRATHWPFVALILAYEYWRLHLESRRGLASHAAVRGPKSPPLLRRSLSVRQPQKALTPLVKEARPADSTMGKPAAAAFETAELELAVSCLKAQLEDITALLASAKTRAGVAE